MFSILPLLLSVITLTDKTQGGHSKVIVLPDTQEIKVFVNGVEDATLAVTNNKGKNLNVEITVRVTG